MQRFEQTVRYQLTTLIVFISWLLLPPLNNAVSAASGSLPPGLNRAIEVQKQHADSLLKLPGVVGTAVGIGPEGAPVVQVYTEKAGMVPLPRFLDGVKVQEIAAGKFHALEACDKTGLPIPLCQPDIQKRRPGGSTGTTVDTTAKFSDPVPIGVSVGNGNECSAGTIGARLGNTWALSNNHVFARENKGAIGEDILQPGLYDTTCIYDGNNQLGDLAQFSTINFSGSNTIDAAIATFDSTGRTLGCATPSNGYGAPDALAYSTTLDVNGLLQVPVQKYGRTTSLTNGNIISINWSGSIGYSSGTAQFVDQIIVYSSKGAFVKAGDSGSLVVGQQGAPKAPSGLLFAGDRSGKYGIVNRIDNVLKFFSQNLNGGSPCSTQ
jgi:hypothetical protein